MLNQINTDLETETSALRSRMEAFFPFSPSPHLYAHGATISRSQTLLSIIFVILSRRCFDYCDQRLRKGA